MTAAQLKTAPSKPTVVRQLQLASQRLSAECSLCELSALCGNAASAEPDLLRIKRGEAIFRRGQPDHYLYSIRSGSVKISRHRVPGEEQVLGFYFGGDLFGFDGLSTPQRQSDAFAMVDSVLCRLPLQRLTANTSSNQSFSRVLKLFSNDVLNAQEHVALINRCQAGTRLAAFLLDVAGRSHSNNGEGISFPLPMSRYEVASYLGLSVETVSRRLSQLERDQLIIMEDHRKTVRILDLHRLQQLAYF